MSTAAWLVLGFPLLGTLVLAFTYRLLPARVSGAIGTLAIGAAFVCAVITLLKLEGRDEEHRQVVISLYDYAVSAGVDAQMSILIDPLSVLMMLVVTGVSTLIHLYSTAYMASDQGFRRFFAYLNFFVFSMLLLVMAGNFLLLIVGWAFVGAASYLLISFWYRRTTATSAGIKAFVINVVGDVGLVLGTFFLFKHTGTVDFLRTFEGVHVYFGNGDADLTAACLLLLVGA
ncbi:MAG: NADH-quinone oxidoreductase subunit, partial [Solirubrobacteraceae bacterium]|nr:NADH-quinone oxidoreductase subunit [Solirubrobacteraceae bacterium]